MLAVEHTPIDIREEACSLNDYARVPTVNRRAYDAFPDEIQLLWYKDVARV